MSIEGLLVIWLWAGIITVTAALISPRIMTTLESFDEVSPTGRMLGFLLLPILAFITVWEVLLGSREDAREWVTEFKDGLCTVFLGRHLA